MNAGQSVASESDATPVVEDPSDYQNAATYLATVSVDFDEAFVKDNLEEILVLLLQEGGAANGKLLTDRVADVFGAVISSGMLYPTLYDLEDDGVLETEEHIRTKEYRIADQSEADELIQSWLTQLFAVGNALTIVQ